MTFNSLEYAAFLPVVLLLYWNLGHTGQNRLLLVASYLFYGLFDWRFLGLLALSTLLDFWFGHRLAAAPEGSRRAGWLWASIAVNLGILGVFKYADFFLESAGRFLGRLGIDVSPPLLEVLLPVGISFYTFHGISYVFDVYRGHVRPTRNLVDYACFVAYFPQLVAGPIGRATLQLPQFERDRQRPNSEAVESGVLLILLGLFKKVVIADGVAPVANAAFTDPSSAPTLQLVVGALAFSMQIYGDFSGYTDIARGTSRLLGIELPLNFTQPYLSRNITEFWRRWHMSLSNWLRDYLYLPLGGNRGSRLATYRNLFLVMLLGGLWHGASWTFVVWGGCHGLALAVHRWWREVRPRPAIDHPDRPIALGSRLGTFALVTLLWVVFRAQSWDAAWAYFRGLAAFRGGSVATDDVLLVAFAAAAVLAIDLFARRLGAETARPRRAVTPVLAGAAVGAMVAGIIVFSGAAPQQFIYFQF